MLVVVDLVLWRETGESSREGSKNQPPRHTDSRFDEVKRSRTPYTMTRPQNVTSFISISVDMVIILLFIFVFIFVFFATAVGMDDDDEQFVVIEVDLVVDGCRTPSSTA